MRAIQWELTIRDYSRTNASTLVIFQRLLDPSNRLIARSNCLLWSILQNRAHPIDCHYISADSACLQGSRFVSFLPGCGPDSRDPRFFLAWGIVDTILFLGYSTKTSEIFSRSVLLSWAVSAPIVLCIAHIGVRLVLRQFRGSGRNSRSAVIAGVSEVGCHLAEQLGEDPSLGIDLHGFFDNRSPLSMKDLQEKPLLGMLDDLPGYVQRYRIDVAHIALTMEHEAAVTQRIMGGLKDTTACVYFVPNIFLFNLMQARTHEISGSRCLQFGKFPF